MDSQAPDERRRRPMLRAAAIVAEIVAAEDGHGFGGSDISERDAAKLRVKQWGKFARKHGLAYQERLDAAAIDADPYLIGMFNDLRNLGYPLTEVSGLLRGAWRGCELVGFHTLDATEAGRILPYRFFCVRLGRSYPDLVHDTRFQGTSDGNAASWYPAFDQYQDVTGPKAPTGKGPGPLARTSVGRAVSEKLEGLVGPSRPKVKTVSAEFAERFLFEAYRPFDPVVFKYNWAVRGPWLVCFHYDGQAGLIDNGKRTRFLDFVPQVKQLVDRTA